ncbi:MAG: response regulator transcription factor [Chloroflexota bacterium]
MDKVNHAILVIEDDTATLAFISAALEDDGYEVFQAANTQHGLHVARDVLPALILLDLHLPGGSGLDFISAYRATSGPHATLVLMTASSSTELQRFQGMVAGVLSKPFELDDLLEIAQRHCR